MERYALCPGSFRLGLDLERVTTGDIEEAAFDGDLVHLWLSAPGVIKLEDDQQEIATRCLMQRNQLAEGLGELSTLRTFTETRYWLTRDGVRLLSGQLDWCGIHVESRSALVIDYKTGWKKATPSPANLQLRTQAVLLDDHLMREGLAVDTIAAAIVQPRCDAHPNPVAYDRPALGEARQQVVAIVDSAMRPDAPRHPGSHCQHCPAKFICPEAAANLKTLGDVSKPIVAGATPEQLSSLLNSWEAAKAIGKVIEAAAKTKLQSDPLCVPGWALGKPGQTRSFTDAQAVFNRLHATSLISQQDFMGCIKVGLTDLIEAVAGCSGMKKTEAEEAIELHCADLIITKPKSPSLERLDPQTV